MPPALWPLRNDHPQVEVVLSLQSNGQHLLRHLIADTGAGTRQAVFQLILHEQDCLDCGGMLMGHIPLGGAYSGSFPVYAVRVRIPPLNFDARVPVVGVAQVPQGFDGIAGFKFVNRFHYGNFGNPDCFGLDLLAGP